MHATRRALSSGRSSTAVCFDIDGVLLRGDTVLPGAREALARLAAERVPHIFMTNGGGMPEAEKAAQLSKKLGVPVHAQQCVLAHTPLQQICREQYADKRVLILGHKSYEAVAAAYGLRRAVTVHDLACDDPRRYPFFVYPDRRGELEWGGEEDAVAAVMVLYDPVHWAVDLQICLDVVRGGHPLGSGVGVHPPGSQACPVYSANPDFEFSSSFEVPRLAAGAFTHCLQHLYGIATDGGALDVTWCGKPEKVTFDWGMLALRRWHARQLSGDVDSEHASGAGEAAQDDADLPTFERVVHIGDNPRADVRGANRASDPWRSVLVRSGMHQAGAPLDAMDVPHYECEGVADAVAWALEG